MTNSYYSERLLERIQNLRFYSKDRPEDSYAHFHCFIPTDTGRTEDEYRVDFFYRKNSNQELGIYFQSNMTPLEQALLDSALELYIKQKSDSLPSAKELDYYLRDRNDSPCADTGINFNAPIEALELLDWHITSSELPESYPVDQEGAFLNLALEKQLNWCEKAIESFLSKVSGHRNDVSLIAIDGSSVVVKFKNEYIAKNLLEKLKQFLVDFFQEKRLKLIVD